MSAILTYTVDTKGGRKARLGTPVNDPSPVSSSYGYARFIPAHDSVGRRLLPNMRLGDPHTSHEPDLIDIGDCRFAFKRGICDGVHVAPQGYEQMIADIDAQIAVLQKLRQDKIDEAHRHGEPLRLIQAKTFLPTQA